MGIMEKKMETTTMGYIGIIQGLYRDNGKENGNYYNGLFRDCRDDTYLEPQQGTYSVFQTPSCR